jgi:TnpA family transposase
MSSSKFRLPGSNSWLPGEDVTASATFDVSGRETSRDPAAFVLHMGGELTDRAVDFHNRLIGRMFHRADDRRWTAFTTAGAMVNERLHNYARLTEAILKARKEKREIGEAIEAVMDWEMLEKDGQTAARLAKPLGAPDYESFRAHYSQFRQYTPRFLATFRFDAIPELTPLMKAIDTLRKMNEEGASAVPADAPRSFVRQKWIPFVFSADGIDRCYYEFCILSELSLGLRSGDIWVEGSRRYQKFESYLIAPAVWAEQKAKIVRDAEPSLECESYLSQRRNLLDEQLRAVADLTRRHLLPEARMEGTRLVISPLTRSGPDRTEEWANRVYDLVPRVHLTQVLEEVNGWTRFTKAFTHLYTGQPAGDRTGLLTTILAAATNLGKTKMADATESYTADRLAWIEDWYISERNYGHALAEIVRLQGQIPLASQWGTGRTSSSDGQAFPIACRKPVIAQVNAKYGRDPVAMLYTHVSDRYAPFYTQAISSTVRDATHVLDGLLNHHTAVEIEEHYVDTSGYTDHLFALCHLLGFRFAPRIRDLADHRLFCFEAPARYEGLMPLIGGKIHSRTIRDNWDDVARLVASLRQGTASASLLVSKLAGHPRQNHLAVALREIGRIERSLFTLAWLQDPELRRRVTAGLNKGEAHHALKRAIRFYRRGSVSDHTQLEQDLNAMALNLVVAAITLWNTAYLDRAITVLEQRGTPVPAEYLPHISPLGWEHITITGTYHWKGAEPAWGKFRPLRLPAIRPEAGRSA